MTSSSMNIADAHAQAAAFLSARRAKHADFRMEAAGDPPAGDPPAGDPPAGDPPAEKTQEEQLAEALAAVEEWKRHSRTHEDRAKANKAAADELARIKASTATDTEKLAAAEKAAADASRELTRYKVAAETGVPAALLHGDDEDSMREAAKAAIEFRGSAPKSTPKPDPTQGGTPKQQKPSGRDAGRAEAEKRFGPKK